MQHRMDDIALAEWEKKRGRIIERKEVSKEDQLRAEYHSYFNGKDFYIPSEQIRQSMINAGAFMKAKVGNSKKSMKNIVAAMFTIEEEELLLPKKYEIDKRSAVNKNVKARVICIRPKWKDWNATFTLDIDNDSITDETIKEILNYAGNYVGIGSYRPQNNGNFGRFELISIDKI